MTTLTEPILNETLKKSATDLKLYGLLVHWDELTEQDEQWAVRLIEWEEVERKHRGLARRMTGARLEKFKPLVDFDWDWPKHIDKSAISDLMSLLFIEDANNIVFVGPNGVGKSTIAKNVVYQAVLQGHTALFINASEMLSDLTSQDGDNALRRRLKFYSQPQILAIDEVGYLSYSDRHADLLFEVISRRYEKKSTIVTTNRPFGEWGEVFPNASCVVSLVDRLVHHAEIIQIEGDSYRMKEAKERSERKRSARSQRKREKTNSPSKVSKDEE